MNSSAPRIGLVCYGKGKDPEWYTLPILYIEAIRRGGGRPLIIPPGQKDVTSYIELIDGFILAGGGDIEPHYFSQEPHPKNSGVDPERDATELEMTTALIECRIPLLAICRGLQVLNVALRGDLIQHLEDEIGNKVIHQKDGGKAVMHLVRADSDSQVARICGGAPFEVASSHHQAVGRLGNDLRAVAWTSDGIIEAVELDGHPELLAVQWHPEQTAGAFRLAGQPGEGSPWLVSRALLQ